MLHSMSLHYTTASASSIAVPYHYMPSRFNASPTRCRTLPLNTASIVQLNMLDPQYEFFCFTPYLHDLVILMQADSRSMHSKRLVVLANPPESGGLPP